MAKFRDFERQVERLEVCFQKNFYVNERKDLIWKNLSKISDDDLVYVFDHAISNFRYAPTPQEFSDIKRSLGIRDVVSVESRKIEACGFCENDGRIYATSDNGITEKVFKCFCSNSDGYSSSYSKWQFRDRSKVWKLTRSMLIEESKMLDRNKIDIQTEVGFKKDDL